MVRNGDCAKLCLIFEKGYDFSKRTKIDLYIRAYIPNQKHYTVTDNNLISTLTICCHLQWFIEMSRVIYSRVTINFRELNEFEDLFKFLNVP